MREAERLKHASHLDVGKIVTNHQEQVSVYMSALYISRVHGLLLSVFFILLFFSPFFGLVLFVCWHCLCINVLGMLC